jgi:hypothetical protein
MTFNSCASVLLFAATAFAGGQTTAINVTATIYDYDTASPVPNLLLMRSDDYTGSGQATYATTPGNCHSNCMNSVIHTGTGGWQLLLLGQSVRTVYITASPVSGSAVFPSGFYYASVELYANCWTNGTQTGLLEIAPGTSNNNCVVGIDFSNGSTKYKLEMGQTAIDGGTTGLATVSCNNGTGGTCNSWTIVPNTIAPNPTIANLYQFANRGLKFLGQYYNTFRINVTNP